MPFKDLTRPQLLEHLAELQRSVEKWESLVANAPNFIAVVDRDGVLQFLNRVQPGQAWGSSVQHRMRDHIAPAHYGRVTACVESVFQTGETTSYETLATGPHGTQSWYVTYVGPVKVGGEIVAAALFSTDITERKKAESDLQLARETLAQQVKANGRVAGSQSPTATGEQQAATGP